MMATSMVSPTLAALSKVDGKDVAAVKDEIRQSTLANGNPASPTSQTTTAADTASDSDSNQEDVNSPRDTSATALARTFSVPAPYLALQSQDAGAATSAPFARTASAPVCVPREDHHPQMPLNHALSLPPQNATPSKLPSLPKDAIEDEFDIVVNETLPMSLEFVMDALWRDDQFTIDGLKKVGETNVVVSPWSDCPVSYSAFSRSETFQSERKVTFIHNKKNFIGPSAIPTTQIHRYTFTPGQRLVVSVTSSVHDAPFCDYFRAESRWVFNASPSSPNECSLVTGMRLHWSKSTFLKGQIEGFAKSESKTVMLKWVKQAIEAYNAAHPSEKQVHRTVDGRVAAAASECDRNNLNAEAVTPSKLNPDISLSLLRRMNVIGLVVLVVLLLQVMATLYNLKMATNESVRLQKQHQELLSQLMDKMKCVKRTG
ncbi:hypothetical protein H310_12842 [Aphanomyces invadans]|nr:hypothetical protein H310_12842 [Aphanomyces invadans]ETV93007.1 hypothetical protein H310_12842 [Aphanomyces invadans]|eukprot:XP_008878272.1 hypothetical protein H310_12842 [Aphanomyces invadans]